MKIERDFPKMPDYKATWAPIYMEPIMQSGEKITIGVAVISEKGDILVSPAVNEDQLVCVYGEKGISLLNSAKLCLDTLSDHLSQVSSFSNWDPPLYGVTLGNPRPAAGDSILEVVRAAKQMTASFSAFMDLSDEKTEDRKKTLIFEEDRRWQTLIKDDVGRRAPHLTGNFNKRFKIVQGGRYTLFDYLGSRYVANFAKITPSTSNRLSNSIKDAKAKLWSLISLRDSQNTILTENTLYELIIGKPSDNSPDLTQDQVDTLKETILELSEESKREALSTFPVISAEQASQQIIEKDLAA